jgi:hypothetical protein
VSIFTGTSAFATLDYHLVQKRWSEACVDDDVCQQCLSETLHMITSVKATTEEYQLCLMIIQKELQALLQMTFHFSFHCSYPCKLRSA